MDRLRNPMNEVNLIAQIADLKEDLYKNTLCLSTLIECLVDKGVLSRTEIMQKAMELESELLFQNDSTDMMNPF